MHLKQYTSFVILCLAFIAAGCGGPRGRWGFTPQVQYGDPNRLGTHSYTFSTSEGFGIFYTLRGGSIDLDHVRGVADLTRWTYIRAKQTIKKGNDSFRVNPGLEWTFNEIHIQYPPNWNNLTSNEKDQIAHNAALIIAPVVSYHSSIWHEMLTWKGTHFALIEPEHTSAFSWDDLYSNLTGVELAMRAIDDGDIDNSDYDEAMTALIAEELQRMQVVPKKKAKEITESVRGTWHVTGRLMKRNMDIVYSNNKASRFLHRFELPKEIISVCKRIFNAIRISKIHELFPGEIYISKKFKGSPSNRIFRLCIFEFY